MDDAATELHGADETGRPVVSVIVPAWNNGDTVVRALESVLSERGIELECVVVDDGSSDDTAAVTERMAREDSRVVVLHAPTNEGVSSARNRALAVARGEWLTFLDADDRLLPGGLSRMVAAARTGDALAVVGQRIWSDGRWTWRAASYDIPDIRTPGRRSLVTHPGLMFYASATGKLFHRSIIEGLRFEGLVLGDQPWTIRALIRAGDRVVVVADDVYEWSRPRAGSLTHSITAAKYASTHLATEAIRVAIGALAQVSAEAEARIANPTDRARVIAVYFDRLVRSDIAGPILRAGLRGDEESEELFAAFRTFLAAAPPDLLATSDGVAQAIIRPPLDRWPRFREPARGAFRGLLTWLLRSYPGLAGRVSRATLIRPALAIARRSDSGLARWLFDVLLALNWPLAIAQQLAHLVRARLRRSSA